MQLLFVCCCDLVIRNAKIKVVTVSCLRVVKERETLPPSQPANFTFQNSHSGVNVSCTAFWVLNLENFNCQLFYFCFDFFFPFILRKMFPFLLE